MARDYFAVLGLRPGRYPLAVLTRCFVAERQRILRQLDDPLRYSEARRRLEDLHLAYAILRDPDRLDEHLRAFEAADDPVRELRSLIAASLEDGMLRHSRRQAILARARELGLNEFQAHLLIAQVQFGDAEIPPTPIRRGANGSKRNSRRWARAAGIGALALAMFLSLVRWLGV